MPIRLGDPEDARNRWAVICGVRGVLDLRSKTRIVICRSDRDSPGPSNSASAAVPRASWSLKWSSRAKASGVIGTFGPSVSHNAVSSRSMRTRLETEHEWLAAALTSLRAGRTAPVMMALIQLAHAPRVHLLPSAPINSIEECSRQIDALPR